MEPASIPTDTHPAEQLPLAASFALLVTRDDGGKAVGYTAYDAGIAGAVLTDLALRELVVLDGKKVLPSKSTDVPADPVLADALRQIRGERKERAAKWWVTRLSGKELNGAVLASLVANGTLDRVDKKVLGLFPSTTYPEVDGTTERALRGQLAEVISGAAPPTPAAAALVALLDATGTLRRQFGKVPKERMTELAAANWAAPAVKAVLQEMQMVMVSTIAATTAATSVTS